MVKAASAARCVWVKAASAVRCVGAAVACAEAMCRVSELPLASRTLAAKR